MKTILKYKQLHKKHLPYFYEIRFSVEENLVHPHQIKYLQRKQTIADIEQGGGWICKVNDDYVGFCLGIFVEKPIIGGLFVKPEYQSKGIGTELLNKVTNWMFEQGTDNIYLTTDPSSKAEFFYRRRGWKYIGFDAFAIQIEFKKNKIQ